MQPVLQELSQSEREIFAATGMQNKGADGMACTIFDDKPSSAVGGGIGRRWKGGYE